jgi:DGQHR domain-containing protein
MIVTPYIEFEQPIGTFYLSKLNALDLINVVDIIPRSASLEAVQRDENKSRINEISSYCSDPDATFPTPIIISVYNNINIFFNENHFEIPKGIKIGQVLDGQHRLRGIQQSGLASNFELPVVFMFDLIEEEKAYIFSIINSKQTKVSMSLIYDLFALSKSRSPQKTIHELARTLNSIEDSAFYNRLKMLGKKSKGQDFATLSQGTFVKYILTLISKNPEQDQIDLKNNVSLTDNPALPLRHYFINNEDEVIVKIINNLFNGVKNAFLEEWNNPKENILWKTTGFGAIIKSFNKIYALGEKHRDLSESFFTQFFTHFRESIGELGIALTSEYFTSNEQQQGNLSELLNTSMKSFVYKEY